MPEGIPSIAEGIAATLPAVIAAQPAPTQPQQGQQSQQTQQKQEPSKTDATTASTASASTETRKSLSESVPPPEQQQETKTAEQAEHHEEGEFKRQDGENDSKFIKRLKSELAAAKKAMAERTEPKRTEPDADVVKQLQEQLSERERAIEQTAYEKSRKFQDSFVKPIERAEKGARELIEQFTDAKGVYERAMALEGKDRMAFLKEHADDGAGAIFDRLQRINEMRGDRDEALKNFGEQAKELARQEQERETQELSRDFGGTFDKLAKNLGISGEKADAIRQEAFGLLDGSASREDVLSAAALAVHYVRVALPERAEMQKELATLRARVAERQADGATINGRGADKTGADKTSNFDSKGRPLPMQQVIARNVAEALQKR